MITDYKVYAHLIRIEIDVSDDMHIIRGHVAGLGPSQCDISRYTSTARSLGRISIPVPKDIENVLELEGEVLMRLEELYPDIDFYGFKGRVVREQVA